MSNPTKSDIEQILTWQYAVYAVWNEEPNTIAHYVMYPEPPSDLDLSELTEELFTDTRFGLEGKSITLYPADEFLVQQFHTDIRNQFLGN